MRTKSWNLLDLLSKVAELSMRAASRPLNFQRREELAFRQHTFLGGRSFGHRGGAIGGKKDEKGGTWGNWPREALIR